MACCRRPLWWFIGSGFLFLVGVALIIIAALSQTSLYDTVVGGVYQARYIDNTHQTSGCKTLILGDTTCAGERFKGWSMSSKDKYDTCMRSSKPSSKALASASKWCKNGSKGCVKPDSCKPGNKYTFYMFSVLNADEILAGHPAEVREMEPIGVRKSTDRKSIDKAQWDATGVAEWSESFDWDLIDENQASLLNQVVVVPNHLAFAAVPFSAGSSSSNVKSIDAIAPKGARATSDSVMYLVGAANWYTKFQRQMNVFLEGKIPYLDHLFAGKSAIAWRTFVKDAYREGSPVAKLGSIFANTDNCRMLMSMIVNLGLLSGSASFFSEMMCTTAYLENIAISGYSKILEKVQIRVTPDDAMLFHEFDKDCKSLGQKPSYICTSADICKNKPEMTIEECMAPSLSEADADALFVFFEKLTDMAKKDYLPLVADFLNNCQLDGHLIEPLALCEKVQLQLSKSGKAAVFAANPESSDAVAAAYGWTDKVIASTMIPYFVNGTIAQIMNYKGQGLPQEPNSKYEFGVRGWSSGSSSSTTRQQVSSKFGQQGLGYFKSAMGMDHSCAFDFGCMSQASFKLDGRTCTPDATCTPNYAQGYDVGAIPGKLFDHPKYGTRDFHGVGKKKTMFVSDMFLQAEFTQTESSANWGNIYVDKWNVSSVAMRTEQCDSGDVVSVGIDCSSPKGTINIGYNAGYSAGKTPLDVVLPIYSSFPHFTDVSPDTPRGASSYDPMDSSKLAKIHSCASCSAVRDFSTYLWNDPESGMHVRGSQKIQLNYRISSNPANLTRFPGTEEVLLNGASALPANLDMMIPVYWVDKYDVAAQYQKDSIESVQSLPSTFTTVFWVSLSIGLLALIVGGVLLWRGLVLRKLAIAELNRETSRAKLSISVASLSGDLQVVENEKTEEA